MKEKAVLIPGRSSLQIVSLLGLPLSLAACGVVQGTLNPSFINSFSGGVVPLTPGPGAAFVLVRCRNDTGSIVEFNVTIEREVPIRDDAGDIQVDESGNIVTSPERQTVRLLTQPTGQARDLGTLFECGETPVTKIGLGENLLPTDSAVFVGGSGAAGTTGFGVPAAGLNPLVATPDLANFNCGDTVIFQAFISNSVAGGVALQSFLLPGSEQPSEFSGPDTFVNVARFLETQVRGEEQP